MCLCSFSFSLNNFTYLCPIRVVLGGMKCRPAVPRRGMAPQITWLGWRFILATTYVLSKCLPNGHLMYMRRQGTNCCMEHLSKKPTLSSTQQEFNGNDVWQKSSLYFFITVVRCSNLVLYLLNVK